jgi:hypothetical protein
MKNSVNRKRAKVCFTTWDGKTVSFKASRTRKRKEVKS